MARGGEGSGYGIGSLFTGWPMGRMIYFMLFIYFLCLVSHSVVVPGFVLGLFGGSAGLWGICGYLANPFGTYADSFCLGKSSNEIL